MHEKHIWKPISFDQRWNNVNTEKFNNIYPSWERKREELSKEPEQYAKFIDQLKRKQAIDTGIIEQMYDLKRGITETFIKEGFVDSYLGHGDTNIAPNLVMNYLRDNFSAIDGIFDFVKSDRRLSVSYIKELHSLIMQHQDTTDAIDPFGGYVKIKLLKGQFKQLPNNPERDGTIYNYCPPEQVDSEMDNLIKIYNTDLNDAHTLVKAAYVHHAFVQIHPFQDGNGRIARLLTSFVLIKSGLFPFSIDRSDRNKYIDALESADKGEYQPLVDVIADNQINSIERALNLRTVTNEVGYDNIIKAFEMKLDDYRMSETELQYQQTVDNMRNVFIEMKNQMEYYRKDLLNKLNNQTSIIAEYRAPEENETYFYTKQIAEYARSHNYYANLSLSRCWGRFTIKIGSLKTYRMIVTLHHYGYGYSTFAIGAILSKRVLSSRGNQKKDIDIPLGLPPLTMSSEKEAAQLSSSIKQHIELLIMTVLAYIANEL